MPSTKSVVFITGTFLGNNCWDEWMSYFKEHVYVNQKQKELLVDINVFKVKDPNIGLLCVSGLFRKNICINNTICKCFGGFLW